MTVVPAQLPSVADTGRCYLNPETDKTICEATSLDETTTSQATAADAVTQTQGGIPGKPVAADSTPTPRPQNEGLASGECAWKVMSPPPQPGDPRWEGHAPSEGAVLYNDCNGPTFYQFAPAAPGAAPALPPPPPPDPAVLAQQARGELDLPEPTITRSPGADNSDPALGGAPYTWVHLWTWVWTEPQTWVPTTVTVTAGGVSVTATGTPTALVFEPGDGGDPVTCPGPGRPWTERDRNDPPRGGGCGCMYRHVTPDGPLTSRVSIRWQVDWTSNTGAGGTLPELVTSADSSFYVQQIQVVIK